MTGRVLFVSDVHLNPDVPERQRRFIEFLHNERSRACVYVLGDLFDYWVGPRHLDSSDYRVVLEGLKDLTRSGLPIRFVPGNRDYFTEERFCSSTGVERLDDEVAIELGGRRVHLSHGDRLFNTNPKYSAYRRMMDLRIPRAGYQSLPFVLQRGLARGFRGVSVRTTPYAAWSDEALLRGARRVFDRGFSVVICGHIHLPRHLKDAGCELFVMGDWGAAGDYVVFDDGRFTLKRAL